MAVSVGNTIPEAIRPLFAGQDLARLEGTTFLLLTSTPDGWPHQAMLSVGELVALDERHLRAGLWLKSTATTNLSATDRATLTLVHEGVGYMLRLSATRGPDLLIEQGGRLASFDLQVEEAFADTAPYAELTSGVTYRLKDPASVLPRWQETVNTLRSVRV